MSALARLLQAFLTAVLDPAAGDALDPGYATYRRTILATWRGALAGQFPVVERLVGPAFFSEAALRYARAHPSSSGNLHDFGLRFPAFLADYPHAAGLPYLADVARLEWALHRAFHAPGAAAFDRAALARVAPQAYPGLRLHLHPAAQLVRSAFPVLAIWEANQPGRDGTPQGEAGEVLVLVRRDDEVAWPEAIDAHEWLFLEACARGERLGDIAEALPDPAALPVLLRRHVEAGTLAGFSAGT